MITPEQARAARAILNLSPETLALEIALEPAHLVAFERSGSGLDMSEIERLKTAFEQRGIVFLAPGEDDPGVGPGLRLRAAPTDGGMRPDRLNSANDG